MLYSYKPSICYNILKLSFLINLLSCLHMGNSMQTWQPCWSSLIVLCLPGNRFRREHGQILIACAWTYAAIFACSPLAHWGEYGAEPYGTACCIDWRSTNVNAVATSYTVVVFFFCFILPCGVIVTSYSLILVTVKESRKALEQHISGPARMSNAQTTTVKVFES